MPTVSPTLVVPEGGQLVRVRNRHWVVAKVVASSLDAPAGSRLHLAELSSVEADSYGDDLTVFWEMVAGTGGAAEGDASAAGGTRQPGRLAAFLDAVQWVPSRPLT